MAKTRTLIHDPARWLVELSSSRIGRGEAYREYSERDEAYGNGLASFDTSADAP